VTQIYNLTSSEAVIQAVTSSKPLRRFSRVARISELWLHKPNMVSCGTGVEKHTRAESRILIYHQCGNPQLASYLMEWYVVITFRSFVEAA
jgi:hypothetical protein